MKTKKTKKKKLKTVKKEIHGISQSALMRFLACRKKAQLIREGWKPLQKAHALRFGSIWHSFLEHLYSQKAPISEITLATIRRKIEDEYLANETLADSEMIEQTEHDLAVCYILAKRYVLYYEKDFTQRDWQLPESKVEVKYKNYKLLAYIDNLYKIRKELWILETKTKSKISESLMDTLHFDFQSFYYLHICYLKYKQFPKGVVYNIVRKPQIYRRKNESDREFLARLDADVASRPDWYFNRYEISIGFQDYKQWLKEDLDPLLKEYSNWNKKGSPSYKNTNMCEHKYGRCEFLPICSMGDYSQFENTKKE